MLTSANIAVATKLRSSDPARLATEAGTPDLMFGHLPTVRVGDLFEDRVALSLAGVHRPRRAGICGRAAEGAESIILNCAFVDDQDGGDTIVYTGSGARHPRTGRQIGDQTLTRSNLALAESARQRLPVRVSRGVGARVWNPPAEGYRYDGLYTVEDYYSDTGDDGYRIWRFRLAAVPGEWIGG